VDIIPRALKGKSTIHCHFEVQVTYAHDLLLPSRQFVTGCLALSRLRSFTNTSVGLNGERLRAESLA
jgi:hypothetical protein